MLGCPGDPALPAPLTSRVSLLQCNNFSIKPNNRYKAAISANCAARTNRTGTATEAPRCRAEPQTGSFFQRIPKHTPLIQEYSNINSYSLLAIISDSSPRSCLYNPKFAEPLGFGSTGVPPCGVGVEIVSLCGLF